MMGDETKELAGAAASTQPGAGEQADATGGTSRADGQQPAAAGGQPAGAAVAGVAGVPEGMSLQEYVAAEVAKVKAEYEGKGGHLAKLRSTYEKKLAEARRTQTNEAQQVVEMAQRVAEQDPQQALQMLSGLVGSYVDRDAQTVHEAEMAEWAGTVAQQFGLDLADEEVAKVLEEVGPLTDPRNSYEALGRMAKVAIERQETRAAGAEQELAKFREDLPGLVRQQVQTLLVESGRTAVDGSEAQTPAGREQNPIKDIQSPAKLITMGFEEAAKGGGRASNK